MTLCLLTVRGLFLTQLKKYHRARALEMKEAVVRYAEAKALTARDTYAVVALAYARFKELPSVLTSTEARAS